ncbi:sugar nucleotide-binding protein [Candidatus Roizmanbacteria bacterium]|nr:sugar nucleotide-binding protein [Candidatus Roizmanbacteria bacterium]
MKKKNILVLGAQGMLGHTVYAYLCKKFPGSVWGTAQRKNKKLLSFKVENLDKDLTRIFKEVEQVDYVINCIALLESKSKADFKKINSDFPLQLVSILKKSNTRLIHISTDAVFCKTQGVVNEKDIPNPEDEYSKSKLRGEPKLKNSLSIRTSILGFDQKSHKGLLEWFLIEESPQGYINQLWSGCTTLQLAKLLEFILNKELFECLRNKTAVLHFAPFKKTSKYEILNAFNLHLKHKKEIKQIKSNIEINRQLETCYPEDIYLNLFTKNINTALQELISFERIQI